VRPVWQVENRRVTGLEVIPLAELGRPRLDVVVRISGFFRDAFPNLVQLIDEAVQRVARADEADADNFVAKHYRRARASGGASEERALFRIFGSKPGAYGAGILPAINERNWQSDRDLAEIYITWGAYAYTGRQYGVEAREEFKGRFREIVIAAKNQDNREHDIFDSDDYMQFHGGMIATVRALTGANPRQFFGDTADPSRPRVRDLADEARRVFRTRVVNPKWIDSMKRHGYKGAFEMAATVDYLFGYDATAQVVEDWMYEQLTEAYALAPEIRQFFQEHNPWALQGIAERLIEAMDRGLWKSPDAATRKALEEVFLGVEANLEARQEGAAGAR
jgi:cobaltochelatase CobN